MGTKKIESDYRIFRTDTEKESDQYRGRELGIIKKFFNEVDERARRIVKKYFNNKEINLYHAKIMGHVTGLAIKLFAEVKT